MYLNFQSYHSQLQSTIAAATSSSPTAGSIYPHHPITCVNGELYYDEDGTFSCEHAKVPPDDQRANQAVTHSIALLIMEEAFKL